MAPKRGAAKKMSDVKKGKRRAPAPRSKPPTPRFDHEENPARAHPDTYLYAAQGTWNFHGQRTVAHNMPR